MIYDFTGTTVWGHSGNHRGQSSYLRIVPEHDLVIAAGGNGGAVHAAERRTGRRSGHGADGRAPGAVPLGRSAGSHRRKWTSRR